MCKALHLRINEIWQSLFQGRLCEQLCTRTSRWQRQRERGQKKKLLGFDAQARQGLLKWKEDKLLGAAQQMSRREYWQFGARLRRVKSGLWARSWCLGAWELVAVGKVDKEKEWVLLWRNNIQNKNVFMQLWKAGLQRLKRGSSVLTEGKGDKAWTTSWFWRPPRGQI